MEGRTRGSRSRNFLTPRGGRRLRLYENLQWEMEGVERGQRIAEEAKLYLPPRYASPSSIITV